MLADQNILYRRPGLYDALASQDGKADALRHVVARYGPPDARTVLDLGCGTGLDLAELAAGFACVGVDTQEQMVAYGRKVRPQLDLRVGDLRSVRLGATFDVVLCVGNTLTYLAGDADRRAAFATFAAHAHPATLLVIQTLVAPIPPTADGAVPVDCNGTRAEVTTAIEWHPETDTSVMHRRWRFADGEEAIDRIERRVTRAPALEQLMADARFKLLDLTADPTHPGPTAPTGPSAWALGRYSD